MKRIWLSVAVLVFAFSQSAQAFWESIGSELTEYATISETTTKTTTAPTIEDFSGGMRCHYYVQWDVDHSFPASGFCVTWRVDHFHDWGTSGKPPWREYTGPWEAEECTSKNDQFLAKGVSHRIVLVFVEGGDGFHHQAAPLYDIKAKVKLKFGTLESPYSGWSSCMNVSHSGSLNEHAHC